jgi:predicted nucleotidyltransferase
VSTLLNSPSNFAKHAKLHALSKAVYEANPAHTRLNAMDLFNQEVQDFLRSLHQHKVRYMLVGGLATTYYGHVRMTMDLDLWVQDTAENKDRLIDALKEANVAGAEHYRNVEMIPGWSSLSIGTIGFEVDLMGYTKAFRREDFNSCYQQASVAQVGDIPITIIHLDDLIREKEQLGRLKDQDDVQNLRKTEAYRTRSNKRSD